MIKYNLLNNLPLVNKRLFNTLFMEFKTYNTNNLKDLLRQMKEFVRRVLINMITDNEQRKNFIFNTGFIRKLAIINHEFTNKYFYTDFYGKRIQFNNNNNNNNKKTRIEDHPPEDPPNVKRPNQGNDNELNKRSRRQAGCSVKNTQKKNILFT